MHQHNAAAPQTACISQAEPLAQWEQRSAASFPPPCARGALPVICMQSEGLQQCAGASTLLPVTWAVFAA